MKRAAVLVLAVLFSTQSLGAQSAGDAQNPWRVFAESLEPGAFVQIRLKDGHRISGTVAQVTPELLRIYPRVRTPAPIRNVSFMDIQSVTRLEPGMSPGKKVWVGVGIGVMGYLLLVALLMSQARN
jgi:hypothetical protein